MVATDVTDLETGPFGIGGDLEWDWDFYVQRRMAPTDEQFELAVTLSQLAGRVRGTGRNAKSVALMKKIVGLFSAALVNKVQGDLTHYKSQAEAISSEFYNEYLTVTVQNKLAKPFLRVAGAALLVALVSLFYKKWAPYVDIPPTSEAMLWMVSGALFGRVIYLGTTYLEVIKGMEQYLAVMRQISRVYIELVFDIFASVVAFVVFSTGFLVVTIGATQGKPESGISSLGISTSTMIAFAFGILVGMARTEFLKKIKEVADSRVA